MPPPPQQQPPQRRIRVLLTGFARFHQPFPPFTDYGENPSWLIVSKLAKELSIDGLGVKIDVITHHEAIQVNYSNVLREVPLLWDQYKDAESGELPDFLIHVGAGYSDKFELEKLAHYSGYEMPGVDGELAPKQDGWVQPTPRSPRPAPSIGPNGEEEKVMPKKRDFEKYPWEKRGFPEDGPEEIVSGVDVDAVCKAVNARISLPEGFSLSPSRDPGRYMCDFIFYTSLNESIKRFGESGVNRVSFIHVPTEGTIDTGVEVLHVMIQEIVRASLEGNNSSRSE